MTTNTVDLANVTDYNFLAPALQNPDRIARPSILDLMEKLTGDADKSNQGCYNVSSSIFPSSEELMRRVVKSRILAMQSGASNDPVIRRRFLEAHHFFACRSYLWELAIRFTCQYKLL